MGAHLEPITYIVRAGKTFSSPPDTAECSGTVTIDEDGVATIRGLAGNLSKSVRNDIVKAVNLAGHKDVRWKRRKNGKWIVTKAPPLA